MTGHRTVIIRHAKLRRELVSGVDIREIVLWQRSDVLYQVAITTYREDQPRAAAIHDTQVGPNRSDAIAAFEEAITDSHREGFEGR